MIKPSKAALKQLLEADLECLEIGLKLLGVEAWLNLRTQRFSQRGIASMTPHARPPRHIEIQTVLTLKIETAQTLEIQLNLSGIFRKLSLRVHPLVKIIQSLIILHHRDQ